MSDLHSKYKHLAHVHIPEIPFTCPENLIGLGHLKLGIAYETREGFDHSLQSNGSFGIKIIEKQLTSIEDERTLSLLENQHLKLGKCMEWDCSRKL